MNDREMREKLFRACVLMTRHLGTSKGYFPQVGAPDTFGFTNTVKEAKKHLGSKIPLFLQFGEDKDRQEEAVRDLVV